MFVLLMKKHCGRSFGIKKCIKKKVFGVIINKCVNVKKKPNKTMKNNIAKICLAVSKFVIGLTIFCGDFIYFFYFCSIYLLY